MKTNTERVLEFLKKFEINEAEFEKNAGLANAAISNNIKNKGKFSDKSLEKILKAYPIIRKEWLYLEQGPMVENEDMANSLESFNQGYTNEKLIGELLDAQRQLIASKNSVIEEKEKSNELLRRIDHLQEEIKTLMRNIK